jgi:hypothetical protein
MYERAAEEVGSSSADARDGDGVQPVQAAVAEGEQEQGDWAAVGARADEVIAASQQLQQEVAAQSEEVAEMRRSLAEEAVRVNVASQAGPSRSGRRSCS